MLGIVVSLSLGAAPQVNAESIPTCFGRNPDVVGTPHDDKIFRSGNGLRVVVMLAGDDEYDYEDYSGRDIVCGNSGNDYFYPFNSPDKIDGGPGNDHMEGGWGPPPEAPDVVMGGSGDDTLAGSLIESETLASDGNADVVDGGPGADTCYVDAFDKVKNCETIVLR